MAQNLGALASNAAIAMSDLSDATEYIQDTLNTTLVAGANVTLTYNDVANTLTIASAGGGGGGFIDTVADTGHPGTGTDIDLNVTGTTLTAKLLSSTTPQLERLGLGVAAGGTARLTLPATASLAGGIDFGGTASLQYQAAGHVRFQRPSGGASIFDINSATGQDNRLMFSLNGTEKWRIRLNSTNDQLHVSDGTSDYMRFRSATDTVTFPLMATDNGLAAGTYQFAPGAAWDVASVAGDFALVTIITSGNGLAGGVNDRGVVSDDDTAATDAPCVTTGATTFFYPFQNQHVHATKGALIGVQTDITVNKPTGTAPSTSNNYNEAGCYVGGLTTNNRGANTRSVEFSNTIQAVSGEDGGPARARTIISSVTEQNLYSAYNSTTIFGASSHYLDRGSVSIDVNCSSGAGYTGTGILFRGAGATGESSPVSAFKRAIVIEDRTGADIFTLDGRGRMGFGGATNNNTVGDRLSARLVLGWTDAGAESTVAADGILFGDDVTLFRSNTDVLATDDQFNCLRVRLTGTTNAGFIDFGEQSGTVADPGTDRARIWLRPKTGDATKSELVVTWQGGTVEVIKAQT